jgi:hypothetical protein
MKRKSVLNANPYTTVFTDRVSPEFGSGFIPISFCEYDGEAKPTDLLPLAWKRKEAANMT